MALSQAEIERRIAAIRKARDSGVLIVRHGDESTQFRSLDEMDRILAGLEGQLGTVTGTKKKRISYIRQDSKGL
jgi:hypothetical protein